MQAINELIKLFSENEELRKKALDSLDDTAALQEILKDAGFELSSEEFQLLLDSAKNSVADLTDEQIATISGGAESNKCLTCLKSTIHMVINQP